MSARHGRKKRATMPGLLLRLLAFGLLLMSAGAVQAACEAELGQLAAGLPEGMPRGLLAAQLLYGAVELVEPALPALNNFGSVPVPADTPGYGAVSWLLSRGLLPDSWQADTLDEATWREMLSRFLDWYELELPPTGFPGTDLVAELGRTLDQAGSAVRPVAIVAHDENRVVQFVGILWNWTRYPRLLVKRVPAGTSVADGTGELLSELGNCAVRIGHYASAPVATAWRLFVGSGDSTMYVLASDPGRPAWPLPVEQAEVRDYLEFTAPTVAGLTEFSAAFSGQEIGFGAILSMVTQIRTNVSPFSLGRYLEVPAW